MNFESIIETHKRKSQLVNNLVIDLQYLVELAPQVFNKNTQSSPHFTEACDSLAQLCDRAETQIKELKEIIPVPNAEGVN